MTRVRSPNYPALSLPEAISRVKVIHEAEQHLAAPKDVIAKHLGYNGLNGAALTTVSAIGKYGLIEEAPGDKMRVSPLAVTILYPPSPAEKTAAIKEAASKPALFVEIDKEWEGHRPSDENLRSYLIRRNFAVDAIDRVIKSYRETIDLVTQELGVYPESLGVKPKGQEKSPMQGHQQQLSPGPYNGPFKVSFSPDGIEVGAILTDADTADALIRSINALKALLPSKPKAPDDEAAN